MDDKLWCRKKHGVIEATEGEIQKDSMIPNIVSGKERI